MHYRAMFTSSEFLTAADLYDEKTDTFRELTVTIERIAKVTLTGKKGKQDGRPGAWFKGQRSGKPLGLNATNCAAIANVVGSPDIKKWLGAQITLRVEDVNIRGEGVRPAVRVVPFRPDQQTAARAHADARAKWGDGDGSIPSAPADDDEEAELARHAAEQERAR